MNFRGILAQLIKPQRAMIWFPALCLIFGLPLIRVYPPFLSGDEITHFNRVYQVSELKFGSDARGFEGGGMLPASLSETTDAIVENMFEVPGFKLKLLDDIPRLPLDPDNRVWTEFTGAALYSPVPYIPHAIGILIGRLFSATPITLLYMARVCALLTWALIGVLALKIIPFYRNVVFVILLTPVIFIKASTVNADVITVGSCTLLVCQVLKMTFGEGRCNRRDILFLFGLSMVLGLSKIAYAPLTAICFLIPPGHLGGKKRFWLICGGTVVLAFAVNLLWMGFLSLSLHLMASTIAQPGEQIRYMLSRPFDFLRVVLRYTRDTILIIPRAMFGETIVWREVWLPLWLVYSLWATVIISVFTDRREAAIRMWKKAGVLAVILGTYVVIIASLYVSFTPLMSPHVDGMQARYMFPLLLPALLLLKFKGFRKFEVFPLCLLVTCVSLTMVLVAMHTRFV